MSNEKINIEYEIEILRDIAFKRLGNKKIIDTLMGFTKKYFYLSYDKVYKNRKIFCSIANKNEIYRVLIAKLLFTSVKLFNKNIFERKFHECLYLEITEKLSKIFENDISIIWNPNNDRLTKKVNDKINKILDKFLDNYEVNNSNEDKFYSLKFNAIDTVAVKCGSNIITSDIHCIERQLLSNFGDLRQNLLEKLGYYFHFAHIFDDSTLNNNEYKIFVRDKLVFQGTYISNDEKSIDEIFSNLEKVIIENIHTIFSIKDTYQYLEYVEEEYSKKIVENLLKELDINDIKTVFCNLIQKEISIRDLPYVVENLANFARFDKDTDILTEKMIQVLK